MEHGQHGAESVGAILSGIAELLREVSDKLDSVAARVGDDNGVEARLKKLEAWAFRTEQNVSTLETRLDGVASGASVERTEATPLPRAARRAPAAATARLEEPRPESSSARTRRTETARIENSRLEALPTENSRHETLHAETPRTENSHHEASRIENSRLEAPRTENSRLETLRAETQRTVNSHHEAPRTENSRHDTPRSENSHHEATRIENSRLETLRTETSRPETLRTETSRTETPRPEAPRAERLRPQAPLRPEPAPEPPRTDSLEAAAIVARVEQQTAAPNSLPRRDATAVPPALHDWVEPNASRGAPYDAVPEPVSNAHAEPAEIAPRTETPQERLGFGTIGTPVVDTAPRLNGRLEAQALTSRADTTLTAPRDETAAAPTQHHATIDDNSHVDKLQAMLDELKRNPAGPFGRPLSNGSGDPSAQ
ncbi:hypothetical protein [Nocardia xishanensis]|uniref:Uncharacterized protein n=1 Tax=Nocardia xishanensis TaxID=238964 RepID=A0ABW7WTC3_9NOCA